MAERIRKVVTGAEYAFGDMEQKMLEVFDAKYDQYVNYSTWADDMDTPTRSREQWNDASNQAYFELQGMYHMLRYVIPECPPYAELTCSEWAD